MKGNDLEADSLGVVQALPVFTLFSQHVGDLSSTELLVETSAAWILTGELPTPRDGLRGANIDQRVLMTGNK